MRLHFLATVVGLAAACAEPRTEPVDESEIWAAASGEVEPDAPIAFESRASGATYGLPEPGMRSIADLIALFPARGLAAGDPNVFVEPDLRFSTDQCRGGAPRVEDDLPLVFDGVVTVHPRQYMKVEVCGQDERHYGVFAVEDDTGGVVVLRDARVAPFTVGDRVRVTARAITLTFGPEVDTRAILVSEVEPLPTPTPTVLFSPLSEPFAATHVGKVQRVDGYVHVEPTSLNFNALILTSAPVSRRGATEEFTGNLLSCVRTCEVRCIDACPSIEACADICPDLCIRGGGAPVAPADIPVCWNLSIDTDLARRGFQPEYGVHLRATGPVINNFDVQMWVLGTGQIEEYP